MYNAKNQISDGKQIAKQYRTWRIKMFLGMYFGYLMYYLTRKNLPYAAPSLISELGITKIEFGILGSVMSITYGIGKFLAGMLADKCNIRTFMAFGLIGSSIINLFFGFLTSLPLLILFWGLNGGLQSMGFPSTAKGMIYWFSQNERGTIWTLFASSKMAGIALASILSSFCISKGYWRAVFYIPGIIGLITGISLLFTLTDKPTSLGLPPVEIYRNDTTSTIVKSNLTHWQILKKYILINPSIWFVSIAAAFIYFIRFVITDWGITFMVDNGIKCDVAGRLLVFTPLFGIFGGISAGWISGKFFKNRYIPISLIYLFCSIFCIFGLYHSTNQHMSYWIIVIFFALIGIFIDGPQTIACGVLVTRITVQESIGTAIGIVGIFEYIGVFISGIGAAWIIEKFNWAWLFTICAILSLLAMFLIALIYKKELLQIKS